MLTKAEKLIILGITAFVAANILLFLSDLSSETIGMIYVGGILIMSAIFYARVYIDSIKKDSMGRGKDTVEIEIRGVSKKDTVTLYVDEKVTERYMGEISGAYASFKCRQGKHVITVRHDGKCSSAEIDTAEMKAKIYVNVYGSDIRIRTEYTSYALWAEGLIKDRGINLKKRLILLMVMGVYILVVIVRILLL